MSNQKIVLSLAAHSVAETASFVAALQTGRAVVATTVRMAAKAIQIG